MYIYKITNLLNNKIYIGQHNGKRRTYFGGGKLLKFAIIKYGKENFSKEIIIDDVDNQNFLDYLERHYIQLYASTIKDRGYNIRRGGKGEKPNTVTDEFREKVRVRMYGNTIMLGRKRDKESKEKQAKTLSKIIMNRTPKERRDMSLKSAQTRKLKYDFGKLISDGRQKNKKLDWNNKQTKPIIQETKSGEFVKLWASAYQAQKEEGYRACNISGVCYKKYGQKFHRNYNWRFANEEDILMYNN